jgi:hypothetical protein
MTSTDTPTTAEIEALLETINSGSFDLDEHTGEAVTRFRGEWIAAEQAEALVRGSHDVIDVEPQTTALAIKTGSLYTLVLVDADSNQCRVKSANGGGFLIVQGTTTTAIKKAATHGAGFGYRTLGGLRSTTSLQVVRRRDLDC